MMGERRPRIKSGVARAVGGGGGIDKAGGGLA